MITKEQIAFDAKLSKEEFNGREADLDTLTRCNPNERVTSVDEAYGIKLRADDQIFSDSVFIVKSKQEMKLACDSIRSQLAHDATVFGAPSNGVLEYYTTVFNNKLIKQVLKSTPSREMTKDWQMGAFGTTDINVPTLSFAGQAQIYADSSGQGQSSVNYNWINRQAVTLQRTLEYGDLTQARFGMAKIDYVGNMREGVTNLINLNINDINFRGFEGMDIYGLLNDPSLYPFIVAPASSANPASSQWIYKNYLEICDDVRSLFDNIIGRAGGQADYIQECVLGLAPAVYTYITKQNALGTQSVREYLEATFTGMKIIQVPNYQGTGTPTGSVLPNVAQLIFDQINGQDVAYNLFSSLYNSHGVIRMLSSYEEKVSYTISGSFIGIPVGVASITGI